MKKKILALTLFIVTILLSIVIVISPSFTGKSLSYVELHQELTLDYVLNGQEDVELIFFGYAGCLAVCTPRLHKLQEWYKTLSPQEQKRVTLKFFDLSIPLDHQTPDIFVKSFHPNFKGVYLNEKVIRDYTKLFSVYFAKSFINEGEIDHSTYLYIVKRTQGLKELRAIYTSYPYDFAYLSDKIKGLLNE